MLVTQSRKASEIASLSVRVPLVTVRTSAPSRRMRYTFSAWRWVSSSPMYTTHSRPSMAHTVAGGLVPVFYALAMGTSGLGSLLFGRLFDRRGIVVLVPLTALTALFAPLAFLGNGTAAFFGTVLWGVGLGVHESVMQAAVAQVVPAGRLASAYGLFNLGFGVAWFAGSAVMGALYDLSIPALVVFSMIAELAAIPLFLRLRRHPALRGSPAA